MSTLLSLFDGSGGFPLAASICGITPVAASEIEPYPIAVTRSRFPDMIHLGSVTDINGGEIPPVDIITFGSPCQDLSVAGKRAGLKHEANGDEETTRSGLFMEAVRIIKEMREATNGEYPTFALWENVPGAFSSNKGEDFRTVLEELIRVVEPHAAVPRVPRAGWAYADSFSGSGWSLAYRVFDAQYWGVPQRRRRIHLVADFRGERAREVLFEREGVRGYFEASRTPWKGTAPDAEGCPAADDRAGESAGGDRGRGLDAVAYSFDSLASNSMKSSNPHSGCRQVEVAKTLDTTDPNPSKNQGGIAIVEPIPYTLKIRSGCEGGGKGALIQEDKSATLATNNDQYLFQPVGLLDSIGGQAERGWIGETAPTLKATHYKCPPLVAVESAGFKPSQDTRYKGPLAVCPVVSATYGMGGNNQPFVVEESVSLLGDHVSGTLMARDYKGIDRWDTLGSAVCIPTPVCHIVRRLTPTECARLQGFPDLWGHPDQKTELTEEEYQFWLTVRNTHAVINGRAVKEYTPAQMLKWYSGLHTDSAEYKMWGNGIALPCALYVMEGIAEVLKEEANPDVN